MILLVLRALDHVSAHRDTQWNEVENDVVCRTMYQYTAVALPGKDGGKGIYGGQGFSVPTTSMCLFTPVGRGGSLRCTFSLCVFILRDDG